MTRARTATRWLATTLALVMVLLWLVHLGHGDLSAPAMSPSGLRSWFEQRDTATATFAVLRVVALVFGVYLLAVAVAGGTARTLRLARTTAVIDRVTLPFARTMFGGVALLGMMAAPPAPSAPLHDTMVELPADPADQGHATLHLLPDAPAPTPLPATDPAAPVAPVAPSTAPSTPSTAPAPSDTTWIVQHGESFWLIAQSHLDDLHGRHVDEREVTAYWRELIDANRSRLVTSDPDLLFTGQVIDLPAVAIG